MVAGDLNPTLVRKVNDRRSTTSTETPPEVDILPVGDATLYTAAPVCCRSELSVGKADEEIVMLAPGNLRPSEA